MKKLIPILICCMALLAGCRQSGNPPDAGLSDGEGSVEYRGEAAATAQSVVYEAVEIRRYSGENAHHYVHSVIANHTDKTMVSSQFGMLAYDSGGNPLQIDWYTLDTDYDPSYFYLCDWDSTEVSPNGRTDENGGWSLNVMGNDPEADRIAYVLYCHKEITFDDGTAWVNPGFADWRSGYEGKAVDTVLLENYYPFQQMIEF